MGRRRGSADTDCDDGDICTIDTCDKASGCCRSVASPLCHTQLPKPASRRSYYDIRRSVLNESAALDSTSMRRQPASERVMGESTTTFVDDKPVEEMPLEFDEGLLLGDAGSVSSAPGALQTRGGALLDGSTNSCPMSMSNGIIAHNADLAPKFANDANQFRAQLGAQWLERIPFYMSSTMPVLASQMRG